MITKTLLSALAMLFLLAPFNHLTGQYEARDRNLLYNKKPAISSPEAAALEKYVEFPTANHTGVPDISIPIYLIELKSLKIPITLSYHASGIKLDDAASNVGSGWTLGAGGAISILANGLRDEASGFPNDSVNFQKIKNLNFQTGYSGGQISCNTALMFADPIFGNDPMTLYSGADIDFLRGVVQETTDSEPDIYAFNFLGHTGKFFKDQQGVFRTIPLSDMKIENIVENNLPAGYRITDENGTVYEFKAQEGATENIYPGGYFTIYRQSVSYFLSKITTLQGDVVNFYYSGHPYSYDLQKAFARAKTSPLTSCWQYNQTGEWFYLSQTTTTLGAGGLRIDSINASNGALIKFIYSANNRTDLATKKLDSIQVWNHLDDRRMIKQFALSHDYSTNRLTLKSVQEIGKPATELTYNLNPSFGGLPPRLSLAQDHYGYFNGKTMNDVYNTLLPKDEYMEFWEGADREVDTNYTQAGMLTKMTHPTGGTTEFFYEPNMYYVGDTTTIFPKVIGMYKASFPDLTVSDTFTIPSTARKIRIDHTNSFDGSQIHNDYCIIHLTGPNNYSRDFVGNASRLLLELDPGLYTLSIENVGSTYSAEATIYWFNETKVPPHNEIGGGLRIREIKKTDSLGNVAMIKRYEYLLEGTNRSSGINMYPPVYFQYKDQNSKFQGSPICTSIYCQFIEQNSNSVLPLAFANGNFVVYSQVKTYIKDSLQSGYTVYKYHVDANGVNNYIPSFPYAPRVLFDWTNGMLLEQKDYGYGSGQFKLLRKIKNFYNYLSFDPQADTVRLYTTYGAKVGIMEPPFVCWQPCDPPVVYGTTFENMSFGVQRYQLYASWQYLTKTEECLYSGTDSFKTSTSYYYESPSHIQATKIETLTSKGETLSQNLRYARDYNAYGFIATLINKNIISIPVEKTIRKKDLGNNEFIIGGEITKFKTADPWPEAIYTLELSSPLAVNAYTNSSVNSSGVLSKDSRYKEAVLFSGYDNKGNITEISKSGDMTIAYLWDYGHNYPVAEVQNASITAAAYTSFESDGQGSWSFSGAPVTNTSSPTGIRNYSLSAGNITRSGLSSQTTYIVSYWTTNTVSYSISGTTAVKQGKTIGGWTYFEHKVSGITSVTISGSGNIDELRLYPQNALMTTYTYSPLNGMTSQCNVNNVITYYEYDTAGRLKLIKDQDKNVIKVFDYQYKSQQ